VAQRVPEHVHGHALGVRAPAVTASGFAESPLAVTARSLRRPTRPDSKAPQLSALAEGKEGDQGNAGNGREPEPAAEVVERHGD